MNDDEMLIVEGEKHIRPVIGLLGQHLASSTWNRLHRDANVFTLCSEWLWLRVRESVKRSF